MFKKKKLGKKEYQALIQRIRDNDPSLTELHLCRQMLHFVEAREIVVALGHNSHITKLDMSNNRIGDSGVAQLANLLSRCQSLTSIDISYNSCGYHAEEALETLLQYNFHIVELRHEESKDGYGLPGFDVSSSKRNRAARKQIKAYLKGNQKYQQVWRRARVVCFFYTATHDAESMLVIDTSMPQLYTLASADICCHFTQFFPLLRCTFFPSFDIFSVFKRRHR